MHTKDLSEEKRVYKTKRISTPIKTSNDIKTMCHAHSIWSISTGLAGCHKIKDEVRLERNESALKRRRLRKENIALRRKICQMERLLEIEGK